MMACVLHQRSVLVLLVGMEITAKFQYAIHHAYTVIVQVLMTVIVTLGGLEISVISPSVHHA